MVDSGAFEYLIFGIGNPLLDISVEVKTDEILKKYDLQHGQACLAEEKHMPIYDEMWKLPGVETIPGGSALNSMRSSNVNTNTKPFSSCFKQLSQTRFATSDASELTRRAMFSSKNLKRFNLHIIIFQSGVKGNFHQDKETPTGTCAVIVHEKERSLCANLAACLKYPLEHLTSNMKALEVSKFIYSTSFFITSNFQAL